MRLSKLTRSPLGEQLVDDVIESYVMWREEAAGVGAAYDSWALAAADRSALAFAGYLAALDREERASREYQRFVDMAAAQ
jgi:hypothetical protein